MQRVKVRAARGPPLECSPQQAPSGPHPGHHPGPLRSTNSQPGESVFGGSLGGEAVGSDWPSPCTATRYGTTWNKRPSKPHFPYLKKWDYLPAGGV